MLTPTTDQSRAPDSGLRSAVRIQFQVLSALIIRDLMSRYGRHNIGFVWAVLEPMILTVGVMILWSATKSPYQEGVQIIAFVFTGYLPLTLWRHITGAGVHLARMNAGMLYHRNVTLLDIAISRCLVEFAGTTAAAFTVGTVLLVFNLMDPPQTLAPIIAGWICMGLLSFGVALLLAAGTASNDVVERFVQPVQYLLIPLSGAFYMTDWLPAYFQSYVLYLPLPHAYESIRHGYLGDSTTTYYSYPYLLAWIVILIGLGVFALERAREDLSTS